MKDRDFLIWLHERLSHVHEEIETMDYMHKLRAIIISTEPNKISKNCGVCNNIEDLRKIIT